MKITVAVPTFNRKEVVNVFSVILGESIKEKRNVNIRIYDDCSTEYNKEELEKIFFYASEIRRRKENLKADKNMYQIYKDFLNTSDEVLVQLDSDMLLGKKFFFMIELIAQELKKEKGVYSLYNSSNHSFIQNGRKKEIENIIFKEKKDIGGACVIFSREIIEEILKNIDVSDNNFAGYDWKWSEYLVKNNIPIYVSEKSFVQHIGLGGQNNISVRNIDIGKNFIGAINLEEANFINQYYEKLIQYQRNILVNLTFREYLKIKIKKNKYFMKIYKILLKRKKWKKK